METFDRGSAILVEVEFKTNTPFANEIYYDPTVYTINVYNANDEKVVEDAALMQSATGKYYYVIQSLANWITGIYDLEVNAGNGSYTDITFKKRAFKLI